MTHKRETLFMKDFAHSEKMSEEFQKYSKIAIFVCLLAFSVNVICSVTTYTIMSI